MTGDDDTTPFLITPGPPGTAILALRFPPEFEAEVRLLLDKQGLTHSTALEFSVGPELWIESVNVLAGAGGLAALAAMIRSFVHRHDGKRFVFERDSEKVELSGMSEKAILRTLERVAEQKAELDAEWQRLTREEQAADEQADD